MDKKEAMAGGYDKFFKEARRNSGIADAPIQRGRAPSAGQSPRAKSSARSASRSNGTPEDRMREELALRMKRKRQANVKAKAKFPLYPAIFAVVMFVVCGFGYFRGDVVEDLYSSTLGRVDISFLGSAKAAEEAPAKEKSDKAAKKICRD